MKAIIILALSVGVLGCGNVSSSFAKSGKYAASLLDQYRDGHSVYAADLTKAFAEAQADATSGTDKEALRVLSEYRLAVEWSDGSKFDKDFIAACGNSTKDIFDNGADPNAAGAPCWKMLSERTDKIIKETSQK